MQTLQLWLHVGGMYPNQHELNWYCKDSLRHRENGKWLVFLPLPKRHSVNVDKTSKISKRWVPVCHGFCLRQKLNKVTISVTNTLWMIVSVRNNIQLFSSKLILFEAQNHWRMSHMCSVSPKSWLSLPCTTIVPMQREMYARHLLQ